MQHHQPRQPWPHKLVYKLEHLCFSMPLISDSDDGRWTHCPTEAAEAGQRCAVRQGLPEPTTLAVSIVIYCAPPEFLTHQESFVTSPELPRLRDYAGTA